MLRRGREKFVIESQTQRQYSHGGRMFMVLTIDRKPANVIKTSSRSSFTFFASCLDIFFRKEICFEGGERERKETESSAILVLSQNVAAFKLGLLDISTN